MNPGAARGWERPLAEHRAAVDGFIETVADFPESEWFTELEPGGWTAAQVAEHVVLAEEYLLAELQGGPPLRIRTGPAMERLLRWFLLPHILFHRTLPVRVKAPREVRPEGPGIMREAVADRLRSAAKRLEREVQTTSLPGLTHPYFGRISPRQALRFIAVHTEHHDRQLKRLAASA